MQLPYDFIHSTRQLMGDALYATLEAGLNANPLVSIRINPFKLKTGTFDVHGVESPVPWCPNGFYLAERPNFTFDPMLHQGLYYVQEAASMFINYVVRNVVQQPVRMLDLCAAPGGKSTCAYSALPAGSVLFSNEPMRQRAQVLNENILKFGVPHCLVTNNYARDYQKSRLLFDVVLADVPCSGEGMFRKDAGAIADWSLTKVAECTALQRKIITDIWPCLKPNGLLIYSTCTFNAHENEENVVWIAEHLGADFISVPVPEAWHITGSLIDNHPVYRLIPGKTQGEGLFMAVLRKRNTSETEGVFAESYAQQPVSPKALAALNVLSHGPLPDEIKGKTALPHQSKALSIQFDTAAFPQISVSYAQAIAYLRGEALTLPTDTPRGIVALRYANSPLGFVKNVGNRANNLYPQAWKIKSTHLPDTPPCIIQHR